MAELIVLQPAEKYLKKLKDKKLKQLYKETIDAILANPEIGKEKTGDLKGVRCCDIYYNKTNYELAYSIEYIQVEDNSDPEVVIIILAGTRENFYEELKRYWK